MRDRLTLTVAEIRSIILKNCIIVVCLSFVSIVALTVVDTMFLVKLMSDPYEGFLFRNVENFKLYAALYDILKLTVFMLPAAYLMLRLHPRRKLALGIVGGVATCFWLEAFHGFGLLLNSDLYHAAILIAWILTLPILFWVFAWISEHQKMKPTQVA